VEIVVQFNWFVWFWFWKQKQSFVKSNNKL
jgi:hypothetical protein